MGIVFRQSVKTSIVVFSGTLLGAFTLWLSTRYFDQQQYGFVNTFAKWALLLSFITPIGLNNTLAVFIHRYNNENGKRKMFLAICLILPALTTILLSLIYFFFPNWILHHFQPDDEPLMRKYYFWLPVYTLFFVYMSILEQYLCSQMKVAISAFMREILLRLINIMLILFFAFGYLSFDAFIIGTVLTYVVPTLIFLFLSFKTKGFGISFRPQSFTKAEYKEIASFSWYHYLLNVSVMLMTYMDVILIPFYDHKGFSTVAIYVVAVYLISLVNMPSRAFLQVSYSSFANAFAENNMEKTKDFFVRSSMNLLIATTGLAVIMCCNLENAVAIIGVGKNYTGIIPVFLVLLLGQMVNVATGMNELVLSVTNYSKFNFYVSIIVSCLLFLLIRLLVPCYGIYGAAWAATITLVLYNLFKFYFVWKKIGMQPLSYKTILVIIAALPALAAGYFMPYFFNPDRHVYIHTFIDTIARSALVIVIYLGMLIWLKPSEDLELYLASIRKNKKLF